MKDYLKFLERKRKTHEEVGFKPLWIPDSLFPFQQYVEERAIWMGRYAILADCGLGKSPLELIWAENIVRKENKNVLLLTPLAVGPQMIREGEKFGVECKQSRDGKVHRGITVTNYEQLSKFRPEDFIAVVCDESSILKALDGKTRKQVTAFLKQVKYRLLATATPSPNDYMELGSSSEALGVMSRSQMLGMFFTNDGEQTQQWNLKGHARKRFWQWICSWAIALRKPSDLGFPDKGFILPELHMRQHLIRGEGDFLGFWPEAVTLDEQRVERKRTLNERCEKVAELIPRKDFAVVWCHLNPEGDLLEEIIPDAVQVQGSDPPEVKEERLTAFSRGQIRTLITKPKIGGFGLNWQHCNRMTFFPSHSFEMFYQAIRRCWRFGQKREVIADIITGEGENRVLANMQRKEKQASEMFSALVAEMTPYQRNGKAPERKMKVEVPEWLQSRL